MTNHHPAAARRNEGAPTPKQQRYIRTLALAAGVSFTPPTTKTQASQLIQKLKALKPDTRADRTRELRTVQGDLQRSGDQASVREDEITGHGSTATWNRGQS